MFSSPLSRTILRVTFSFDCLPNQLWQLADNNNNNNMHNFLKRVRREKEARTREEMC